MLCFGHFLHLIGCETLFLTIKIYQNEEECFIVIIWNFVFRIGFWPVLGKVGVPM
jgi:hypothetical protein